MGFGYDMDFTFFNIMFTVIFIIVIGLFIMTAVRGISTWNKNNNSPLLTVPAVVVAKRMDISHHSHTNAGDISGVHGSHMTSSTWYYVTFQVASGDRIELCVAGPDYGRLIEGDEGNLSFKGTRYVSFDRK